MNATEVARDIDPLEGAALLEESPEDVSKITINQAASGDIERLDVHAVRTQSLNCVTCQRAKED